MNARNSRRPGGHGRGAGRKPGAGGHGRKPRTDKSGTTQRRGCWPRKTLLFTSLIFLLVAVA